MDGDWFRGPRATRLACGIERPDGGSHLRRALEQRSDAAFDAHYGGRADAMGHRYWTPLRIATRVARTLLRHGATRVLDVGSGPGKFCLAAASACPGIRFTGIEQRSSLVALANRTAAQLALPNVAFVEGNAFDVDWRAFDALYFYNPFGENLYPGAGCFDHTVELSNERYLRETARTEAALAKLGLGTIVITYHGMGGAIPGSFDPLEDEPAIDYLHAWIQARKDNPRSECWREMTSSVRRARFPNV